MRVSRIINGLLFVVILLMAGGGYFEYQVLQNQASTNQQQIADLKANLQKVTSENSDLTDTVTKLKQSLVDAQAKEDSLTKNLQAAQAQVAQATAPPPTAAVTAPAGQTSPGSATGPFTTKLGTITTLGGTVYANCQLLKISAEDIVISYTGGITQVQFALLPPSLQQRFGFDPKQGMLTNDQVQALESQRQSAFAAGR